MKLLVQVLRVPAVQAKPIPPLPDTIGTTIHLTPGACAGYGRPGRHDAPASSPLACQWAGFDETLLACSNEPRFGHGDTLWGGLRVSSDSRWLLSTRMNPMCTWIPWCEGGAVNNESASITEQGNKVKSRLMRNGSSNVIRLQQRTSHTVQTWVW